MGGGGEVIYDDLDYVCIHTAVLYKAHNFFFI